MRKNQDKVIAEGYQKLIDALEPPRKSNNNAMYNILYLLLIVATILSVFYFKH